MSDKLSIIIPMAGLGSRLRPLTWSRPKPLVSLAGVTVLDHLLAMFKSIADRDDVEYVFVMSPGQQVLIQAHMQKVYPHVKVHYVEQPEKKGQSDALWHAREFLSGEALILFSDDDTAVPSINGICYYLGLKENKVPASLHIYPSGGHGWGIRKDFKYHDEMLANLRSWLSSF